MAVVKTVLKNTEQEAVVKVAGTAAAATITLTTDILAASQALDGETQTVNIVGLVWTGAIDGIIQITRNSVVIATLQANAAGALEFSGQAMIPETISNTQNIVVTISGAQAECWLRLRKVSGYKSKVEYATYGAYDDETRVGASTTLSGSPDKV
jgi:hypothetical protein